MRAMTINLKTEYIKLDQLLKYAGIAGSGADAKAMIVESLVMVNGQLCTMRGKKLFEKDSIVVDTGDEKIQILLERL